MKRASVLLFLFCLLTSTCLFSQDRHSIDSILKLLTKSKEDTNRVKYLVNLADQYITTVPDTALVYSNMSLALSEKLNYPAGIGESYNWMGQSYRTKGDYAKALDYFEKSIKAYRETGNQGYVASAVINMGNVYIDQGNYDKGYEKFLEALRLCGERGDKARMASVLGNIGVMFQNKAGSTHSLSDYQQSINYNGKAYAIDKELNDKYNVSIDLNNLGSVYSDMGKLKPEAGIFDKALAYFQESYKMKREVGDSYGEAIVLVNMGDAYVQKGSLSKDPAVFILAASYGKRALAAFRTIGDPYGAAYSLNVIGLAFANKNQYAPAPFLADSALSYLKVGMKDAESINAKDILKDLYSNLSLVYEQKKDFQGALKYERLYTAIKDTILNAENAKHMNEMQTKYETAEKDKELIKRDAEISRQESVRNAFIIGFALVLALAFFIFRSYRQKKKANVIITKQKEEVEQQKQIIEEKNRDIMDSIMYARRIQRSLLPTMKYIEKSFKRLRKE